MEALRRQFYKVQAVKFSERERERERETPGGFWYRMILLTVASSQLKSSAKSNNGGRQKAECH